MKKWLKYFIYLSVVFLLIALWKADYLVLPDVVYPIPLIASIILLYGAYITKSLVWRVGLHHDRIKISFKDSIISTGIAELGKYIPGKLWVIVGRALYISEKVGVPLDKTSTISFNVQLLVIWSGLMIGSVGLIFIPVPMSWAYLSVGGWLILSLVLFNKWFHNLIRKLVNRLLKREVEIPIINPWKEKKILLLLLVDWCVRMAGFYILLLAISEQPVPVVTASGYPLAVTLGIVAIIAPGGIGVREGILLVWLQAIGFSWEMATTAAVATRLWSLIGELGIFVIGMILRKS